MDKTPKIRALTHLPLADLETLLEESRSQGFEFLDRLVTQYQNGANRFNQPGEVLLGVYDSDELVAVGGLNVDPYLADKHTGRVRHVYVLSSWRRQGVGTLLMDEIIQQARKHFRRLTLRTFSSQASRFYLTLGFKIAPDQENITHFLDLHT